MNTYDQGVMLKYNVDSEGRPTSWFIPNEQHQVNPLNNLVHLVQIPDENQRVVVWDDKGKKLSEVFNVGEINDDSYKVEYNSGLLRLHPRLAGKTITVTYYGRGVELISTKRIYHKGEQGVFDVLHDVIERSNEAMEAVGALGGVAETIQKLEEKIDEGNTTVDRIEGLVSELEGYGYTITLSREAFVVKANESGEISKGEIASVYTDVVVYKGGKPITPTLSITELENCEFKLENQRIKLVSMNIDAVKCSALVVIDCGDNLIVKRRLEVTKVFDGQVPYIIEMTNGVYGFETDSLGLVSKEQTVTCDISVTKADIDYTNYSIQVQNKPQGLNVKINPTSVTFTCSTGSSLPSNGSLVVAIIVDTKTYARTFTWHKIKQGESAKSLILTGGQILKYNTPNYSDIPLPYKLTLSATATGLSGTPTWYAKHNGDWVHLQSKTEMSLVVMHDDTSIWNGQTETIVKCELGRISDELSIVKLANGQQGQSSFNVILTNENHAVSIDNSGVVSQVEIDRVRTNVLAYYGLEQVTPVVEKGELFGCDISIVGNTVQLVSLDNSFTTATATINVTYGDITVPKVLTISKTKQGNDGQTGESAKQYVLNITEGSRSISYSQINIDPRPSVSSTFIGSFYENGEEILEGISFYWVAKGHVSGESVVKTFTPTISTTFEETVLDNNVTLTVFYKGQTFVQTVPIAITKDASGLEWVTDWDGTKVEINGNKLLAPKFFAGEYNQEHDLITGVAIGRDILNDEGITTGIAGYQNNKTTFLLDTDGTFMVGNPFEEGTSGLYFDGNQLMLRVDQLTIEGSSAVNENGLTDYVGNTVDTIHGALNDMNNELQEELTLMNGKLNDLETTVGDGFKDGIIDEIEKARFKTLFTSLETEVINIRKQYSSVIENPLLKDEALRLLLAQGYEAYNSSFSELQVTLEKILASTIATEALFNEFNSRMDIFRTNSALLGQRLNQAILSISQTMTNEAVESAKGLLQGEIDEVQGAVNDLNNTMVGSFKEGIISQAQIMVIQDRVVQLNKEKEDIDGQYESLYNNTKLGATKKGLLVDIKGVLDTTHGYLINKINSAVVDYIISQQEIDEINKATTDYSKNLREFSRIAQLCIDDIAVNSAQGAVDKLDQEAIFNKLTNNGEKQGLYLVDKKLYINGEYVNAKNLKVTNTNGEETLKIDENGNVSLKVTSFNLTGGATSNVPNKDEVYNKDEVDGIIDGVNSKNSYRVNIQSTQGNIFKNGEINTTLKAIVYNWEKDVTDTIVAEKFIWTRTSLNPIADEEWNRKHQGGTKTIAITRDDVNVRATFNCDILGEEGVSILE